jgi:hypothetical protein
MKPNSAQMIDVVNTRTGRATHEGRSNFPAMYSAKRFSQVIRRVRWA